MSQQCSSSRLMNNALSTLVDAGGVIRQYSRVSLSGAAAHTAAPDDIQVKNFELHSCGRKLNKMSSSSGGFGLSSIGV